MSGRADDPAFPRVTHEDPQFAGRIVGSAGMTLREHYAGLAMQGLVSNDGYGSYYEGIAVHAIKYADALLAALAAAGVE